MASPTARSRSSREDAPRTLVLAAAGAILLSFLPARAQVPADLPRVTGSAELTLVNVDVVVTGKDGKPVGGLTAADFAILHDGKPVAITNFREEGPVAGARPASPAAAAVAAPSSGTPLSAPVAATPEPAPLRRHVVLFVDHLALPDPREREEVFGSLKTLLRRTLQPSDAAMVVAWRGGVQRVFPYTGDIALLERELDVVAATSNRLGRETQQEIEKLAADDRAYAWAGSGDSALSRNLNVQEAWAEVRGKATALKGLIATMSGMEGRKALIFVSRSFSRRPGSEFFGANVDATSLIDSITAKANAAGVTLHCLNAAAWEAEQPNVDASPLVNPRTIGPSGLTRSQSRRVDEAAALDSLAERTGGVVIGTTMEAPLFADRVASDLTHWYSIGYPVPEGGKSADVSVRVLRPGLSVRSQRSIVDRSPVDRLQDRVLANLFRMDENARLPIAVSAGEPRKEKKDRYSTSVLVRVPVRHLVLLPTAGGMKGAVSVFTVAAGPGGDFSDVHRERREVVLPAEPAGPASSTVLSVESEVVTKDPAARISVGVWDENGGEAGFRLIRPKG